MIEEKYILAAIAARMVLGVHPKCVELGYRCDSCIEFDPKVAEAIKTAIEK